MNINDLTTLLEFELFVFLQKDTNFIKSLMIKKMKVGSQSGHADFKNSVLISLSEVHPDWIITCYITSLECLTLKVIYCQAQWPLL